MTWVVGAVTPIGQAFIIADTRVTFGDKREADLIQKVYWIGRDMVAGFSGSVKIGFALLNDLARKLMPENGADVIWKPEAVAKRWSVEAAALFNAHDEDERRLQCSVLIAAVAPRNNGPFPYTVLIELRSPHFKPHYLGRYGQTQIGSGKQNEVYREWVEGYFNNPQFMVNFATWETAIGSVLAQSLSDKVKEHPKAGVSPYMHVIACGRGTRSLSRVPGHQPWDDTPDPFPFVATTFADFQALAEKKGFAVSAAAA